MLLTARTNWPLRFNFRVNLGVNLRQRLQGSLATEIFPLHVAATHGRTDIIVYLAGDASANACSIVWLAFRIKNSR
jgi:hypothetical protein